MHPALHVFEWYLLICSVLLWTGAVYLGIINVNSLSRLFRQPGTRSGRIESRTDKDQVTEGRRASLPPWIVVCLIQAIIILLIFWFHKVETESLI
jgi:hypothetical protein